jgi:hypothetical protein
MDAVAFLPVIAYAARIALTGGHKAIASARIEAVPGEFIIAAIEQTEGPPDTLSPGQERRTPPVSCQIFQESKSLES